MDLHYIHNEYEKAESCVDMTRQLTGIMYDHSMALHECPWDSNHIENPNRYWAILKRCEELNLLNRCLKLPYNTATKEHILTTHSDQLFNDLKVISSNKNLQEVETRASEFDSVYFNEHTFNAATTSAGIALSLVEAVCKGEVENGMAIIRPPGHHAMCNEFCGFCYFNNVAIAAQHALNRNLAKKILIVDIDVHHGQATQEKFYNTNQVLYFSIHRYEHGAFWPNLRESNFDFTGEGDGTGYNINFPLNVTGCNDSDYLSIVLQILLPVAYEFQPDLVIVSAGYDASIGCPEGQMEVSPAFYGHLITLLSGLAKGKIAVCLEGGYFLPSLAEGVAMTIKALLGDTCPMLPPLKKPHSTIIDTINNLRIYLAPYWNCFEMFFLKCSDTNLGDPHLIEFIYNGEPPTAPHPTRNCYPVNSIESIQNYKGIIQELRSEYLNATTNQNVCFCYDDHMLRHSCGEIHYENPNRVSSIYETYYEWDLHKRCLNTFRRSFDIDVLKAIHTENYVNTIVEKKFESLLDDTRDMYFNDDTFDVIMKANECLLTVVDSVLTGESRSGVALIRPPGHHAEPDQALGFCFINNIAVAAAYILKQYKINKILILDFDVHHGNGTQKIFYENDKVLYLSIHKYSPSNFFPNTMDGDSSFCGEGTGAGYNINIGVSSDNLYNVDYIQMFLSIVLPIIYSFAPEVILVSAGFDAGINDPLGGYHVTPECYGHFIQLIKPFALGRIIMALEGGYNNITTKYGMNICIKTLLGDPLPILIFEPSYCSCFCTGAITAVKQHHRPYWPILDIDKNLFYPEDIVHAVNQRRLRRPSRKN
ncbi:hypothetical protein FQA39_LY00304 [Lamprigera yunnana]|nr:hypothetical protein FQA39_LY00304 [Lamprigera yunnana]